MIGFHNFHNNTIATFTPCHIPDRDPDFTSPSGSCYWDNGDRVIRAADHWGARIKSCDWYLSGDEELRPNPYFGHQLCWVGECKFSEFGVKFDRGMLQINGEYLMNIEWLARESKKADAAAKLARTLSAGRKVRATRTWTERLSARKFITMTDEIVFRVAKTTKEFVVTDDGRRFARHTLANVRGFRAARQKAEV